MVVESVIHSGPVTALYLGDNFVLAGIGSSLHVYSLGENGRWTKRDDSEVLPGRNIHRIKHENKDSRRFIISGQKSLRLIEFDLETKRVKPLQDLVEFSDWIWDVAWMQDTPDQLCLALGHNVVVMYDLKTGQSVQTVSCEEKCILYCAKFVSGTSNTHILAAGTVFNQVVLWSPACCRTDKGQEPVKPFHRLTGHQGVIFSIDYNERLQKLCSASDDRSLRLYQIDFPGNQAIPGMSDWTNMKSTLLHVLYGHQARVWDVRLLASSLISVGEDATCCVWSYDGEVIQKFKGHKGKSIWSIAAGADEDLVVTGGGDHSIRLWRLQTKSQPSVFTTRDVNFKLKPDDFPRNTLLLDLNEVLAITDKGNILLYSTITTDVTCLMSDSDFSSYTVVAVSKVKRFIVIGNIHGVIRILYVGRKTDENPGNLSVDMKLYDGKVFSVHFIEDDIIITTGPNGFINVIQIHHFDDHLSLIALHKMELTSSRHRWVTTAMFLHSRSHLVCGDRTGSIFLYKLAAPGMLSELVQTFPKIHGKAGVTHVSVYDDVVYSCGRDGLYRLFTWRDREMDLLCQNSNRVFKGFEWLERITFTPEGDTLMAGFHTNLFLVWSMNQNQSILEIDCGGGHRSWDYISHGNQGQFVFIKTREVKVTDVTRRSNQTVVKSNVHGREICDVKHLFSTSDSNGLPLDVLITCSEDTTLHVIQAKYTSGLPEFSILHTLTGHISSVRCIAVCSAINAGSGSQKDSKLVISGGGRAQIRIWRVKIRNHEIGVQSPLESSVCYNVALKPSKEKQNKMLSNGSQVDGDCSNLVSESENMKVDDDLLLVRSRKNGAFNVTNEETSRHSSNIAENLVEGHQPNTVPHSTNIVQRNMSNSAQSVDNVSLMVETDFVSLGEIKLGKAGRRLKKPWRYPADNSDPETRILDLCLFSGQEISQRIGGSLFFFAAACSDGLVRLFAFEEDSREITLISSSKYHEHCVLKTSYIMVPYSCNTAREHESSSKVKNTQSTSINGSLDNQTTKDPTFASDRLDTEELYKLNQVVLLSAATDGKVAFYNITSLCYNFALVNDYIQSDRDVVPSGGDNISTVVDGKDMIPCYSRQLHQSGINSLHCQHLSDDTYVLITGGDDNALTVSHITMVWQTSCKTLQMDLVKEGNFITAHSAQITGVWCLGMNLVLSVSIDQRLCLWNVVETESSLKISMADCKFVNVSDVSNIDVFSNSTGQFIIVSGEGLQMFKIDRLDAAAPLKDIVTKSGELIT